jgi:hypothetical protein
MEKSLLILEAKHSKAMAVVEEQVRSGFSAVAILHHHASSPCFNADQNNVTTYVWPQAKLDLTSKNTRTAEMERLQEALLKKTQIVRTGELSSQVHHQYNMSSTIHRTNCRNS